jgi:hypothetical protein
MATFHTFAIRSIRPALDPANPIARQNSQTDFARPLMRKTAARIT